MASGTGTSPPVSKSRKKKKSNSYNSLNTINLNHVQDFSLDSSESLTKISDQNALEYLDSGKNFIMDRLRFEFLEQREQRINPKIYSLPSRDKNNL